MIYREELMIGNIVSAFGKEFKVLGILPHEVILNVPRSYPADDFEYKEIDPLKLNVDIIKRFGFELSKDYTNNTYRIGNFFISPIGDILSQQDFNVKLQLHYGKPLTISKIRYAHELQNIYFAITGKKI